MRRADRLFAIVQSLRRRRVTTAARLATELEVSLRTIYRDVEHLLANGVPIAAEAGVGYSLPKGFDLPAMTFAEEELAALVLGARIVASWGDEALAAGAKTALTKIEAVVPEAHKRRLQSITLLAPSFHVPRSAKAILGALRRPIEQRKKVRFTYERDLPRTATNGGEARSGSPAHRHREVSTRTVWPLGLAFWGSVWSLGAYCELRQGFRTFRLDRMRDVHVLDETFPVEPGRTLDDYLAVAASTANRSGA
jgi:predicted DNA-binding transcriptional regulator YafY